MKTYLKYIESECFGVIAGSSALSTGIYLEPQGKLAICAALQDVAAWNIRQGRKVIIPDLVKASKFETRRECTDQKKKRTKEGRKSRRLSASILEGMGSY